MFIPQKKEMLFIIINNWVERKNKTVVYLMGQSLSFNAPIVHPGDSPNVKFDRGTMSWFNYLI